jgi:hypothetical protein
MDVHAETIIPSLNILKVGMNKVYREGQTIDINQSQVIVFHYLQQICELESIAACILLSKQYGSGHSRCMKAMSHCSPSWISAAPGH